MPGVGENLRDPLQARLVANPMEPRSNAYPAMIGPVVNTVYGCGDFAAALERATAAAGTHPPRHRRRRT